MMENYTKDVVKRAVLMSCPQVSVRYILLTVTSLILRIENFILKTYREVLDSCKAMQVELEITSKAQ